MRKYIRGNVSEQLTLTTLAAQTLVSVDFDEVTEERMLASSIVGSYSIRDFTPATGDGPVKIGIAHSDYSDAELEEWMEQTDSWDEGDLIGQEVAKRKIRTIGIFRNPDSATLTQVLKTGLPIKTKLNWILRTGQTLSLWAYNMGSSAFATTAPIVEIEGHVNLWPR